MNWDREKEREGKLTSGGGMGGPCGTLETIEEGASLTVQRDTSHTLTVSSENPTHGPFISKRSHAQEFSNSPDPFFRRDRSMHPQTHHHPPLRPSAHRLNRQRSSMAARAAIFQTTRAHDRAFH